MAPSPNAVRRVPAVARSLPTLVLSIGSLLAGAIILQDALSTPEPRAGLDPADFDEIRFMVRSGHATDAPPARGLVDPCPSRLCAEDRDWLGSMATAPTSRSGGIRDAEEAAMDGLETLAMERFVALGEAVARP